MVSYVDVLDVDDDRGRPRVDPSTWPTVTTTMCGFEFPQLTPCRALRVQRSAAGGEEDPDLLMLEQGNAYYLGRRIMKSLFGAVFHGLQGACNNPNNPSSFRARKGVHYHIAVKRSSLAHMRHTPQENVFREVSVMRYLSAGDGHPYVMPLVDACITRTHIYVVTPFCPGGDLLKSVKPQEGTGENRARKWFRQILLGIGYIHSKGLCHHDLSPENVVITGDGDAAVVMDMGMVQRIPMGAGGEPVPMQDSERFGKLRYMAPEIYANQEYDGRQADIWSVGTTLVVCLAGEYPWEAPTRVPVPRREIFHSDIYRFKDLAEFGAGVMLTRMNLTPPRVSQEAVDLICTMLVIDRGLRPTSAQALAAHPFCVA